MLVSNNERLPQSCWDDGRSSPDVEDFGSPPRDDPRDRGITGDAPGRLTRDRAHIVELGTATVASECLEVQVHGDVWPLPGHLRPVGAVKPLSGIGAALGAAAHVTLASDIGVDGSLKSRHDGLAGLRIEVAIDPDHAFSVGET